ncbi:MAG TPA: amidohydrolase/deacetylase family metallohydrolase [Pseudomonadales bacterium]|nr:amidohydrolase/deacetylase family metallohydrolase [Pseudomonadales bacterium]
MTTTLISGGLVFDHVSGNFSPRDLLVDGDRIADIAPSIDKPADNTIDASGKYVSPGFIDLHCHIFDHPLFRTTRLAADRIGVTQGVACLIDTGSAGPTTIDAFKQFVIDTQETAAFALCNVGSPGLPGIEGGHSSRPDLISLSGTVKAIERNPEWILGVKVLASSSHTGLMGIEAVKIGRKAAEITGTPLMVHIGNAPPVVDEVLDLLRPGDIVTHAYHGKVGGVLGHKDKVIPQFRAAVERGVIVDIAHGRSSFAFRTCEKALEQGMPVHTISSDLHGGNVHRYVVSLARTMSKFRLLGLPLNDIVRAVTVAPANALGLDRFGFGTLEVGKPANITIFEEQDKAVEVEDAEGDTRTTAQWIAPLHVIVRGKLFDVNETL